MNVPSRSPMNSSQARMHALSMTPPTIFHRDPCIIYILAYKTAFTYCGADVLFICVDYSTRWINFQAAGDKNTVSTSGGINVTISVSS